MDIPFVPDYQDLAEDPSSNLCTRSYELVQEKIIGPVQLLSLNPLKWLTNSGKVSRLTMYFKD